MSRAELPAQVVKDLEEILAKLGQSERLSRAGLGRQLSRLLASALGNAEPVVVPGET